jgi:hypothetical protein
MQRLVEQASRARPRHRAHAARHRAQDPGRATGEIRPIAIEDLLGRPQRVLDREAMARLIRGRRVLVTGAGGTIGSELVRQIAALGPAHLTLVDNAEYQLYLIDLDLAEHFPACRARALPGRRARPAPARRDHSEAGRNWCSTPPPTSMCRWSRPTRLEGRAHQCHRHAQPGRGLPGAGVAAMVMISTDKAVHPTNVMGATKRLAECICQALDLQGRARAQENPARASSPCASAMCWARPARSCRCSSASSRPADR